jgi:hypothetical protein
MESGSNTGRRPTTISDAELLRTIGHGLRTVYFEVIKQPLPRNIESALARIEREQNLAGYQGEQRAL